MKKINSSSALVAYLDILGYSDLVSKENAGTCYDAIDTAVSRWYNDLERRKYNSGLVVKRHTTLQIISDSFIVVFDEEAALLEIEGEGKSVKATFLLIFLSLISYLTQECMRGLKRLFRGSIVKGMYFQQELSDFKNGTFIFSKALCEAYRFEKEFAGVPRILLDKSILEEVDLNFFCRKDRPDRELLQDSDGFYYLNIYSSMINHSALIHILRETTSFIKSSISINKDKSILRKYIWFANYHNKIINDIVDSNASASILCMDEIKKEKEGLLIQVPYLF